MTTTESSPRTKFELHERHRHHGLARRELGHWVVFAQSLAATGPSIAIAGTIPLAYLLSGNGAALSFVLATALVLLVGYSVGQFAKRTASTGSLYSYVTSGLGRTAGFAAGWALTLGYLGIAAATTTGAALYGSAFLDWAGLTVSGRDWQVILLLVAIVVAVIAPLRGVRLSTRVAIVLEVLSLIAISAVLVATVVHYGAHLDTDQLTASGSSVNDISVAAVFAAAAFVGFESSSSLGSEARDPYRAIPRAIILTVAGAGLLYIVATYIQVLGFKAVKTPLAETSSPLNALADDAGFGWLGPIVDLGIVISALACTSASLNAASRTLFNLSREGLLPLRLGDAHRRFQTPHVALAVLAPIAFLIPTILVLGGTDLLDIFGYTATAATFGYLVAYALVLIAAPLFLRRIGQPSWSVSATSIVGLVGIGFVIYKNVRPVPAWPYSILPYVFLGLLLAGVAWYLVVRSRTPQRVDGVGQLVERADDTGPTADADPATEHVHS